MFRPASRLFAPLSRCSPTRRSKMADPTDKADVYAQAEEYWKETASNVDGMLGGFERLHTPDINSSRSFLMNLRSTGRLTNFDRALDCGSGIGRITKHLLLPLFKTVDMVDVTEKFIDDSAALHRAGERASGPKTFTPLEGHYDCIWIQWVIGHLNDEDCAGLTPNGCIVLKDNHASGDKRDFDSEDHSWTRTREEFERMFEDARLEVVSVKKQTNFPKGMPGRMITALKKKFGPNGGPPDAHKNAAVRTPIGVQRVNPELQKKFAHGVHFNMKVVIRGDRNTGKTCLWRRLQGQPFDETYKPTDEIQVSGITWSYRNHDHIVKLDVWDVVDESSRRRPKSAALKFDNNQTPTAPFAGSRLGSSTLLAFHQPLSFVQMVCDATFIDVYKNSNGVLLVFDVTKQWTWKPPPANGRLKAPIRFTSSSMKTAQGLKFLYNFFNIPRETLENSLEANLRDIQVAEDELDCYNEGKRRSERLTAPESDGESQAAANSPARTPKANGSAKRRDSTSDSADENQMVDFFEEDFDSNDEDHKKLHSTTPRPPKAVDSAPVHSDSALLLAALAARTPAARRPEAEGAARERDSDRERRADPARRKNSWTRGWTPSKRSRSASQRTRTGNHVRISESSEEGGGNPLVAKFEDIASNSDSEEESRDGSTSRSTSGFTVVKNKPPAIKAKQPKYSPAVSAVLDDFLGPPAQSAASSDGKPKKTKKSTKAAGGEKAPRKTKKRTPKSSVLVDDPPVGPADADEYDPL
ncbi:hypothetical protein M3Y99_01295800 [Aphelenchoides fujianensis]|nr:hypothetical protein M3Y99_01295800 [Aphelenchoides fujianensis]